MKGKKGSWLDDGFYNSDRWTRFSSGAVFSIDSGRTPVAPRPKISPRRESSVQSFSFENDPSTPRNLSFVMYPSEKYQARRRTVGAR